MLDAEALTGAREPGDHLVGDQQGLVLFGQLLQAAQEVRRGHDVAGGALHRLDQDRRELARGFLLQLFARELDTQ